MPVTIQCPRCNKELAAPDELIGKVAACPRCNTQFPVTMNIRGSAPSLLTPAPSTGSVSSASPSSAAELNSSGAIAATAIPSNLPPTTSAPADIRRSHSILNSVAAPGVTATSTSPAAPSSVTAPTAPTASAKSPTTTSSMSMKAVVPAQPAASSREAQPARFITADSTDTRIQLGADGRLPELLLHEGTKPDPAESAERTSHPFRLLAVFAVSFVALIWALTVDFEASRNESSLKAEARAQIERLYSRPALPHHPTKEYQKLLTQALQAHNQGKYADEQRNYRRVLNLLRDEALQKDAANVTGLTGVRRGNVPPSDEHLESLLSRLLSND